LILFLFVFMAFTCALFGDLENFEELCDGKKYKTSNTKIIIFQVKISKLLSRTNWRKGLGL
jgi:hypothetical protein